MKHESSTVETAMREQQCRPFKDARHSSILLVAFGVAILFLLSSCSAGLPVQQAACPESGEVPVLSYSIVCMIHGDGDYLYHDTNGAEFTADEHALTEMAKVAQENPRAEVFIFHQIPKTHAFLFFPRRDGVFYYYRGGRLIAQESYWRNEGPSRFEPEAELFRRHRLDGRRTAANLFLYYGHEIPEFNGAGYDASNTDVSFTVHDLALGLQKFAHTSGKFDLVVLSTCFGGSPFTIGALGMFARTIVASPENLHLSYFDFTLLSRLDLNLRDGDVASYAKRFASHSFDKLSRVMQTAVTIAVYDVDSVQAYVQAVRPTYDSLVAAEQREAPTSPNAIEHRDCGDVPEYETLGMTRGVTVFYQAAHFGRSRSKLTHSGWECWRRGSPQDVVLQASQGSN
jgi:hypothetical protein